MADFHKYWAAWKRLNKQHPQIIAWTKIAIIFGMFWLYSWQTLDPDFGWHLAAGNYIRHHWIPAHDIYTYTARNFRWIDHEWGNDIITSVLYQLGGYGLTSAVFAGLWTTSLCLFRRKIRFVLLVVAAVSILPYAGIRPVVWTVLCLSLLLELGGKATKRVKITIPFLFLIWANLHGGFVLGLAIVAYYFVRDFVQDRQRSWLYVFIASTLASFINPYGPRLYVEIARTLFDSQLHYQITEWRSFYIQINGCFVIILWGCGFWLYDKGKLRNWLNVTPFLLLTSLSATRNFPLYVVGALRDIDRYLGLLKAPDIKKTDRFAKTLVGVFYLSIAGLVIYGLHAAFFPWTPNRYSTYPVQEVAYLQTHSCPGNLFNDYSYGGYLIWKLPSEPVYIDGRMPSWRDPSGEKYLDRYIKTLKNTGAQKAEFSGYDIRCALLTTSAVDKRLVKSLKSQGWSVTSSSKSSVLLEQGR